MAFSAPPFEPMVSPALYPHLSLLFTGSGLFFMALFFTMQVTSGRKVEAVGFNLMVSRVLKEMGTAFLASLLLGIGVLFICLNVGIYV